MKVLVLGDVHGYWSELSTTIARAFRKHPYITHIVQVGDFGYGWSGSRPFKLSRGYFEPGQQDDFYEKAISVPFHWLDGNHENFDRLEIENGSWQPGAIYQSRGSILQIEDKKALFFGGASSIDRHHRTEHVSWWRQEAITEAQVRRAVAQPGPVDILFTHDYPLGLKYGLSYKKEFGRSDREALEVVRQHFKPRFAIFGHHHEFDSGEDDGTIWACAPIIESLEYLIWNGEEIVHEVS